MKMTALTKLLRKIKYKIECAIEYLTRCQFCDGEGGRIEPVTDEGYGPFEPSGFCQGKGYINVFQKLTMYPMFREIQKMEREERKMRRRVNK